MAKSQRARLAACTVSLSTTDENKAGHAVELFVKAARQLSDCMTLNSAHISPIKVCVFQDRDLSCHNSAMNPNMRHMASLLHLLRPIIHQISKLRGQSY